MRNASKLLVTPCAALSLSTIFIATPTQAFADCSGGPQSTYVTFEYGDSDVSEAAGTVYVALRVTTNDGCPIRNQEAKVWFSNASPSSRSSS